MRLKVPAALVAALAFAAIAFAQLPTSKQSNAPTSNEIRIRVLEPLEGATIRGNDFNVVVGEPTFPAGTSVAPKERQDSMKPTYQIWLDGKDLGNIPSGSNVLAVRAAGYGPHKIVVAAKNTAGELIDRKEISVTTTAPVVAETSTSTTTMQTTSGSRAEPPPPVAAPAPPASPPAPAAESPRYTAESPALPKTGSEFPRLALLGVGLAAAGLLIRKRS